MVITEMLQQAEKIEQEEQRKAREEAERKRIQRLEKLAANEDTAWVKVETLLNEKKAAPYDEATKLLVELQELATFKKQMDEYQEHFEFIRMKYGKSVALLDRFRRAGLLKK